MSRDSRIMCGPEAIAADVGGEIVRLHSATRYFHQLNAVGSYVETDCRARDDSRTVRPRDRRFRRRRRDVPAGHHRLRDASARPRTGAHRPMTTARALARKIRSLGSLSWRDRGLIVEAAGLLTAARATLWFLPFRWCEPWLRLDRAGIADAALIARVRHAIGIASRNLPFTTVCLPRAMAAKAMLARRGIGSSLVIGAARGANGEMELHAWLEAGGTIVTGRAGRSAFTPVTRFS